MFQECKELTNLDLSKFNTRQVNDMSYMFNKCEKLKHIIGIDKFFTINSSNMKAMFQECKELENLDLSNFDVSNITDISFMFNGCNKLKEIKGIENFNTSNITNMSSLFQNCNELEKIDFI